MRIRRIPSANAQAMIRVGSPARRSSTVRGGRRRRAADVKGAKALPEFNSLSPIPLSFNDLGNGSKALELLRQANLL